ncbi:MAG: sulfurtransferase [Halioglobus sp.]
MVLRKGGGTVALEDYLMEPDALGGERDLVMFDCRFALADPDQGRALYAEGHIPGAFYLDLNRDLSGPVAQHGGRHPLPQASLFVELLASYGVGPLTSVIAYDDSRFGFAARLWWMLRALGYRSPRLLNGGYAGYLASGGEPSKAKEPVGPVSSVMSFAGSSTFSGQCNRRELADLLGAGAVLIDSREPDRYAGLAEPIDPVAGHIPGAVNFPWQAVTDEQGRMRDEQTLRAMFGSALDAPELLVYCGSGVTACVNLFCLALLGRRDARLYAGSWSDWCSFL